MSSNKLFVWNGQSYDLTRWISIEKVDDHWCQIHLAELCLHAKVSCLTGAVCPFSYLATSLEFGALQITLVEGYVLLRRDRQLITLEFRGKYDDSSVTAPFVAQDLKSALEKARNNPRGPNCVTGNI